MQPFVIVGSGMAAYAVAREFRKLNTEQTLLMICADDAVNYAKPTLSNAFAVKKSPEQIALGDAAKMSQQLNMHIKTRTVVTAIDAKNHLLQLEKDGVSAVQPYAKLILAVGASPVQLNIEGNASQDIHYINHFNDYQKFRQHLSEKEQQKIVILGAGLIGCEFANDLQHTEHQVTVIDVAASPLSRLLPAEVSEQFKTKLENAGIEFKLGLAVSHIEKTTNHQYDISLSNGENLTADLVLSAIGLRANTTLAKQANIESSRGIVVNSWLETTQSDIFAVGDCAEVNGTFLPYVMPIMQQARALAKTLNGEKTAIHYPAMPVAVKTPAAPLTVLPVPTEISVEWKVENLEDGLIAQAFDEHATLRGFVLLGTTAAKQRLSLTKLVPDLIPQNS